MALASSIGEISFYSNRAHWKIPYFLEIRQEKETSISSPRFQFRGRNWSIYIYPKGMKHRDAYSMGWFGMEVYNSCGDSSKLDIRLGIIGKLEEDIVNYRAVKMTNHEYCRTRLIRHSAIESDKNRILPGGYLHLFMSVEEIDDSAVNSVTKVKVKDGFEKLKQDFKEILLNGNISDVVLKVKGQDFKAHRVILAARSPVFLAMMTHETKEKISGVVEIPDIEPSIFSDFLNYLYTGCVENLSLENVEELYTTADKYQVNDLKEICINHMMMNVSTDSFCDVLSFTLRYDEKDLKDFCIQFFTKKSLEIVLTDKWQTFLIENPITGNELFIKHLQLNK